ncbi:hypothetical protein LRS04_16615 [Phenylobacterium sp. J367]|nr:hypothetical protein [Phenylobacterium sp. J367]MCR5879770.1 hypothetical protein [Phenylobacterium sp. J367]
MGRGERPAQHQGDHVQAGHLADGARPDRAAVSKHRQPVADGEDLFEEVGDEDHRQPLPGQAPHHAEQDLGLRGVEAGRGFVEDEHLGGEIDGARDGDELLDRRGIVAECPTHIDLEAVGREERTRLPVHFATPHQTETGRLPAQEEHLGHRQVRRQVGLLIDGGDSQPGGVRRPCGTEPFPVQPHLAGIGGDHAGQDRDQCRLAGPVLAEDRVDLPGPHGQADTVQRLDAGIGLVDVRDLQAVRTAVGHQ